MASDETVAGIIAEVRTINPFNEYADRIESAHKRELAAKDAEIAELQRRLKVAEEFAAEMKESTNSLVRACGHQMILRLQGEGGTDEK